MGERAGGGREEGEGRRGGGVPHNETTSTYASRWVQKRYLSILIDDMYIYIYDGRERTTAVARRVFAGEGAPRLLRHRITSKRLHNTHLITHQHGRD